jgi:hypothetical protein
VPGARRSTELFAPPGPQASSYQRRNRRKQQEADDVAAERAVLRIELSSAQQKLAALQGGTGALPSTPIESGFHLVEPLLNQPFPGM